MNRFRTTTLCLACFIYCCGILPLQAQSPTPIQPIASETLPPWAVEMYGPNPNIWHVDDGYRIWRQTNPTAKTTYSQYYKKWRREIDPYISNTGFEQRPTEAQKQEFQQRITSLKAKSTLHTRGAAWSVVGPIETFSTNQGPNPPAQSSQVNIYCFDQSLSHPDILYSGTEGGEVYKSTDHGMNWSCISRTLDINAPGAIEVHPYNPDIAYMGENNRLWKTTDGGLNWSMIFSGDNLYINDIKYNPAHPDTMLIATETGLYRTTNAGADWTQALQFKCYDIEWKTDDASTAFLVRHDPIQNICRFYKSTDFGETWQRKEEGWFFSAEPNRNDGGARIAVTDADPNRVYAVLIGEAKAGDDGFIGIYRSDDAGETWTLPNPPAGGPWDETTHPCMVGWSRTGGYHQGFYNLGFDASDSNPNALLVGFMSLWYSVDSAATWTCFGGYCGNPFSYVHPDCQEIEINGDDVWMTSDGGIEYSNDFFETHYARNRGITGSDYWGFGQGWNEDIMVGGRYHNGNSAQHENWLPGESSALGGGEAPTGYVNPGEGRKTYFSDLGRVELPEVQNGYAHYSGFGKYPNESYYDAESGEMEFSPINWNTIYVTNENKLWRSTDGGSSFEILQEFGKDINARAMSFEISRSNPDVMFVFQRNADTWAQGKLWMTTNGGADWNELTLPQGYARRCVLALDAEDEQRLWLGYPDANDGEKLWLTPDAGGSWINQTTPALNGEHITYLLAQGGTEDGLYIGTYRTIWFKDATLNDWTPYNEGLPARISTCILRPFYRDNKLRLGAYSKSIWEAPFAVNAPPVAQPMVNKHETSCPGDSIQFDDYSMLSHAGATWAWEFPGGTPETSSQRNPSVVYNQPGVYDVTLTVTNPFGSSTKTVADIITVNDPVINAVPPAIDFSNTDNFTINNPDNGITWVPINLTDCEPAGDTAYMVNNYDYSSYGQDELVLPVNMDLTNAIDPKLKFRVAYAPYYDGNAFIDSLHVLLSYNCGQTFDYLMRSGGEALSTTTSGEGPNGLYEYQVFRPANCEEWRPVEIDLTPYVGKYVTIKFLNKSGYGNQMYLDDIELEAGFVATTDVQANKGISVSPNPTSGLFTISQSSIDKIVTEVFITNATGQRMFTRKTTGPNALPITFSLADSTPGVYFVNVKYKDGSVVVEKLIKD